MSHPTEIWWFAAISEICWMFVVAKPVATTSAKMPNRNGMSPVRVVMNALMAALIAEKFPTNTGATLGQYSSATLIGRSLAPLAGGGILSFFVFYPGLIPYRIVYLAAAVIALPHAKWQERPLALVVAKPDFKGQISKQEIYDLIGAKFNKLWLPDDIVFIDAVPKTSVGKFDKKVLREQFKDFKLPE